MHDTRFKETIREATSDDLPDIIQLLADDALGQRREDKTIPPNQKYIDAMASILADPQAELFVVMLNEKVIGVAQMNYLRYLTYQGGLRAQIEGVRIHKDYQGRGLGKQLFKHLISRAEENHCHLVQLTTDSQRPDAVRFYEALGFQKSHYGLKLHFDLNT